MRVVVPRVGLGGVWFGAKSEGALAQTLEFIVSFLPCLASALIPVVLGHRAETDQPSQQLRVKSACR